jgi:hypothetical protein
MVKLSSYSYGYEDGNFEPLPWEFWTEEEKSQVIYQAYKSHYLTSTEVKPYLDVSRRHMITQFLGPVAAVYTYFGYFKNNIALPLYRRSPKIGMSGNDISYRSWSGLRRSVHSAVGQSESVLHSQRELSVKDAHSSVPENRTVNETPQRLSAPNEDIH